MTNTSRFGLSVRPPCLHTPYTGRIMYDVISTDCCLRRLDCVCARARVPSSSLSYQPIESLKSVLRATLRPTVSVSACVLTISARERVSVFPYNHHIPLGPRFNADMAFSFTFLVTSLLVAIVGQLLLLVRHNTCSCSHVVG